MAQPQEILIVDDEVGIRELLSEILQDEGYRVSLAENAGEARSYRARSQPALVLLDIWMPDTDGVTLLREWAAGGQLTMPVVMMSGHGTIETAVEATKIGAVDFLEKPVGLQKLLATVTRALKTGAGQTPRRVSLAALGTSTPVIEAERAIEQLLRATRPILLVGESGTGHELAARAIHVPDTPFVALQNGSRLVSNPMQLLEDARDGLLYCGEIGGYSRAEQKGLAFLLPKLEKHNTILVCTSSEQLANLAADGRFDAALLASLSVGAVMLPPLRERREDIPALVDRYWREISASQRTQATMHDGAVSALAAAYLLRAAAGQGAEQHEPGRRARRTRAHASVSQAQAAEHPILPAARRGRLLEHRGCGARPSRRLIPVIDGSRRWSSRRSVSCSATSAPARSTPCANASPARMASR